MSKYEGIITYHDFVSFFLRYVQTSRKFFTLFPDKDDFPLFKAERTHEIVKLPHKFLHLTDPLLVPSFSDHISRLLFSTAHHIEFSASLDEVRGLQLRSPLKELRSRLPARI